MAIKPVSDNEIYEMTRYLADRTIRQSAVLCWNWTGTLTKYGYPGGRRTLKGKRYRAHQIAAILSTGRLPNKGETASHICHNPSCCNPTHLTFESHSDNMKRSSEAISKALRKRYENPAERAKTSEAIRNSSQKEAARSRDSNKINSMEQAREIRRLYATGKYTYQELAMLYGCSQTQISNIINNKQWRD